MERINLADLFTEEEKVPIREMMKFFNNGKVVGAKINDVVYGYWHK